MTRQRSFFVPCLALCTLHLLVPVRATAAPTLVLHDVNLVSMTEEGVLPNVSVLVRDGQIAAIAPRTALGVPEDATVVEAAGQWLLPGLIEMHVHLRHVLALDRFLGHGVTTVRNMDGTPDVLAWRTAVAAGTLRGPSITSGTPFLHRNAEDNPERSVTTAEGARRKVREAVETGYNYVKIAELDDEPFFALMDEARTLGIPVVGHIPNDDLTLERILAEQMASIEHVEELYRLYFDDPTDDSRIAPFVELVRRSGVPISTLVGREISLNGLSIEGEAYLTPEREARAEAFLGPGVRERIRGAVESLRSGAWQRQQVDIDFLLRLVRALHEAGVVIVPGTDSGGTFQIPGRGLHEELELLVRAGFSPYEALHAATVDAARTLGQLDRIGTIEVGKQADLVLVAANPLEGLASVREPVGLVVRGEWSDAAELARLRARTLADSEADSAEAAATEHSNELHPATGSPSPPAQPARSIS